MQTLLNFLIMAITLYIAVIVVSIILSWLIAFDVINRRNQLVFTIADIVHRLTEPVLRPIRKRLPNLGGMDLSPLVLILGLIFLRDVVLAANSVQHGMFLFLNFISVIITLFIWVIIISAVFSWLIAFDVINRRNHLVYMVADMFYRMTDPVLRPIRNVMPDLGGLDISPIVLILALVIFRDGVIGRLGLWMIGL